MVMGWFLACGSAAAQPSLELPPPDPVPPVVPASEPTSGPPALPPWPDAGRAPVPPPLPPDPGPTAAPPVPGTTSVHNRGEVPNVVLEKIGPATLTFGRPLVWETVVRNVGTVPVYQIRVEDEIPSQTRFLKAEPPAEINGQRLFWFIDKLVAGEEKRLRIEVQPLEETEITSLAVATFSTNAQISTRLVRPQLRVRKLGPATAVVGETITFRIEVTNTGTGPATNLLVRDQLPAGLQHPQGTFIEADMGTLAAGETKVLNLNVRPVTRGQHVNEVTVTGDDNLRGTAQAAVLVTQPAIKVAKSGPDQMILNTEGTFFLDMSNVGDAPARRVQLIDALPAELTFVLASDNGRYDKDTHSVQWDLENLAPGEKRRVSVRVVSNAIGDLRNMAILQAEPGLVERTQAEVRVVGIPALLLEVVDLEDPLEVGMETRYEICVLNQGSAQSTNLQVVAVVPEGMTLLRAEGEVNYRIQGRQIIFEPLPKLAAKSDITFRVFVRGDIPGDHRFKAQINCDQLRTPVTEEESTQVYRQ
jgi:uncharacterized repeat protein (TIGR01451 family)